MASTFWENVTLLRVGFIFLSDSAFVGSVFASFILVAKSLVTPLLRSLKGLNLSLPNLFGSTIFLDLKNGLFLFILDLWVCDDWIFPRVSEGIGDG